MNFGVISSRMKIEFADSRLALIRTSRAHELGLPVAVVKAARSKLQFIAAAKDERDLRGWKSLNYKKLEGFSDNRHQIRLNDQYRMIMVVSEDEGALVATIFEIGDPH
jgi:toxin HigB-1